MYLLASIHSAANSDSAYSQYIVGTRQNDTYAEAKAANSDSAYSQYIEHYKISLQLIGFRIFAIVKSGVPNNSRGPSSLRRKPNRSYNRMARVRKGVVLKNKRS